MHSTRWNINVSRPYMYASVGLVSYISFTHTHTLCLRLQKLDPLLEVFNGRFQPAFHHHKYLLPPTINHGGSLGRP